MQRKKILEYFDLLEVAKRANLMLQGPLYKHSAPEKMAKFRAVDDYISLQKKN
jgi:hypothetical protein